jgi:uncharacterized protein YbjT (DUF2867 family)
MKVLLIGGTGLISTAIVEQLVERGDGVTVFNRRMADSPKREGDPRRPLENRRV